MQGRDIKGKNKRKYKFDIIFATAFVNLSYSKLTFW